MCACTRVHPQNAKQDGERGEYIQNTGVECAAAHVCEGGGGEGGGGGGTESRYRSGRRVHTAQRWWIPVAPGTGRQKRLNVPICRARVSPEAIHPRLLCFVRLAAPDVLSYKRDIAVVSSNPP